MGRLIQILIVLLALQVILFVALDRTQPNLAAVSERVAMVDIDEKAVTRLVITSSAASEVILEKQSDTWGISNSDNFPADQDKVAELISKLQTIKRGVPVATSAAGMKRFRVAEDAFERHIQIYTGDTPAVDVFLGTSPRSRMVHVRSGQDTAVYETQMGLYHAPGTVPEWLDTTLVQIAYPDIQSISVPGVLTLERMPTVPAEGDDGAGKPARRPAVIWGTPDTLADNQMIEQDGADALARKISTIRYRDVLGKTLQPGYRLSPPALNIEVQSSDGRVLTYAIGVIEGEENYVLKASNRDEYFQIADYLAKGLLDAADREMIFVPKRERSDG